MSEITQVLTRYSSRRWWISLPFIIALLVLGFILWTGFKVITYPHDGIGDIHPTGLIGELDADGPAAGLLQIDDKIVEIEGVPWEEAYYFYTGKRGARFKYLFYTFYPLSLWIPYIIRYSTFK